MSIDVHMVNVVWELSLIDNLKYFEAKGGGGYDIDGFFCIDIKSRKSAAVTFHDH